MRSFRRIRLALLGLAVAVPAQARAQEGADPGRPRIMHLCAKCLAKRQAEAARNGQVFGPVVDPMTVPAGAVVGAPAPGMAPADCATCQAAAGAVMPSAGAPMLMGPPVVMGGSAPGYAVAGGGMPGYAVVGGQPGMADPAPIGMVRSGRGPSGPGMAASGRGHGSYDPSVRVTGLPADNFAPKHHRRPHIVGHMLGLDGLGRNYRERQARERMSHASIPYGNPAEAPVDLPASMVYDR